MVYMKNLMMFLFVCYSSNLQVPNYITLLGTPRIRTQVCTYSYIIYIYITSRTFYPIMGNIWWQRPCCNPTGSPLVIYIYFYKYCRNIYIILFCDGCDAVRHRPEQSINVSKRSSTPIGQSYPLLCVCVCVFYILYYYMLTIIYTGQQGTTGAIVFGTCGGRRRGEGLVREKRHTTTRWIQLSAENIYIIIYMNNTPEAKPSRAILVYFFSLNIRIYIYIYGFCVLLKRRKNATNGPIGNKLTVRNFIIYSLLTIEYVVAAIVYTQRDYYTENMTMILYTYINICLQAIRQSRALSSSTYYIECSIREIPTYI